MLNAKLLKLIGCTKEDFTTFVKHKADDKSRTKFYTLVQEARSKCLESLDNEDDWDRDWGDSSPNYESAWSCCGVCEIGGLSDLSKKELQSEGLALFLSSLGYGYRFFVYYSITKAATEFFKGLGFKQVDSFINPNTKRRVTVLKLKV